VGGPSHSLNRRASTGGAKTERRMTFQTSGNVSRAWHHSVRDTAATSYRTFMVKIDQYRDDLTVSKVTG